MNPGNWPPSGQPPAPGGPPYGGSGAPGPLMAAYPVAHIPDDEPLVLRPRLSRFVLVFGGIYIGLPVIVLLVLTGVLAATVGGHLSDLFSAVGIVLAGAVVLGALQMAMMIAMGMTGGPYLAAGPAGIWVRARKWPAKAVFLPWPTVARIYSRRWLFDRVVCVQAAHPQAGADAGALARLDMGMQRVLFGAGLTASTFYCGRKADEVLAELHRISGGRVRIG